MLIISVQNFGSYTQTIINHLTKLKNIFGFRTDYNINTTHKIIGVKKNNEKYYITTKTQDIQDIYSWSNYVAIDCRHQNPKLKEILKFCLKYNIKVVADIKSKKDIDKLQKYNSCIEYVATTFCFQKNIKSKCKIIRYAKKQGFKVIAEGGYKTKSDIKKAIQSGADHICIGAGIFDYVSITKKFAQYYQK